MDHFLFDQIKKLKNCDGKHPSILTDLAGPKIRIKDVKDEMVLKTGQTMFIANEQEVDDKKIIISSGFSFGRISEGGKIIINDGRVHLEVMEKMDEHLLKIKVLNGINGFFIIW
jgi:pyruvate kinase